MSLRDFIQLLLFSVYSRRRTYHHWDWQLRKAGSCERSSAWGSRPSQFTYSHMTRPDVGYPRSSPRVQVTKDRKLECSHKLISWAELLQALNDARTSVIQEKAIFHPHFLLKTWVLPVAEECQLFSSGSLLVWSDLYYKIKLYILFIFMCKKCCNKHFTFYNK